MGKIRLIVLALGLALSAPALCGVGAQSSSVTPTTSNNEDDPSISQVPPTSTTGTTTTTTASSVPIAQTGTTGNATTTNGTVLASAANNPNAPNGAANSANATNVSPPPPPVMTSAQRVITPAPTSWQQPPSPKTVKRPRDDNANASVQTATASTSTPTSGTSLNSPPAGGTQLGATGSGRGGASKEPAANIAKSGRASVSDSYTFFIGIVVAGAILAFALFTFLRANSEDAKNRTR